jgi:type VI secretion system protein VasD
MRNTLLKLTGIITISIFLTCCAGVNKVAVNKDNIQHTVKLNITTENNLNKNANGHSTPVILIIYQMKSNLTFNTADFFSIYKNSNAVLGDDLISKEPFVVLPNKTQDVSLKIDKAAQYLGIIAAFQNINNSKWRESIQLTSKMKDISIKLENSNLTVEEQKNVTTK